jgi:transcriptional regulator PpsR
MNAGLAPHSLKDAALSAQDPAAVAALLAAAADVTVLLTADGIICDKVIATAELPRGLFVGWPGKALAETVTVESKTKVEQLLAEASEGMVARWRQVNHPMLDTQDIPISYSAMRVGPSGHIVAVGRDMSPLATLQRRLLSAEQAIEQEYQRLRHAETRFRVLLQATRDAILIVDAKTGRIAESNVMATTVLNRTAKRLQGALLDDVFEGADLEPVRAGLDSLRSAGRAADVALKATGDQQCVLSFDIFRQGGGTFFLLRLVPHAVGMAAVVLPRAQSKVVKIISEMPDGFVVTDTDFKVLTANAAFLGLVQLGSEEQARGVGLDRWLGRQGVDVSLMLARLQDAGEVRNFQTIVRGQFGSLEDVEVSAVAVTEGETPCFGFTLHQTSRQRADNRNQSKALLRSVDDFTRLVGKLPLKDLVRESTDMIERLCIEAALQMNGDNRANAAEMLGLSRQSLYVKLNRFGIDNVDRADPTRDDALS